MGAVNENEIQKQSFQIQLQKILLEIIFQENVITFNGYTSIRKSPQYLVYNASYDNQSLSQDIYDYFGSIENLMAKTEKYKNKLKIDSQSNLLINVDQNIFKLPLIAYNNQCLINLQKENYHPIKPVDQEKLLKLPYSAAVLIISNSPTCQFKGSGAIVGKSIILTVAHIVYDRNTKSQATKSSVWVQTKKGLQQIKVKKIFFPPQYKFICQQDVHKYDFAHLQLEENQIINNSNILPIKWNYKEPQKDFEVIGFSRKLDVQFKAKQNSMFHLRCDRTIKLQQNFITYNNKAEGGISGGPIVSYQSNVHYVIGLHQGMLINFSRGVLLTSYGKNPYQILSSFSNHYALPSSSSSIQQQKIQKEKQKEKEQEILKLKEQIQRIQKEKQKQKTEKIKLLKENQNIKKKLQQKLQSNKNIVLDQASTNQNKISISIPNKNNQSNSGVQIPIKKIEPQKKQLFQLDIGGFFNTEIIYFDKKATKIYLSECNLTDSHLQKLTQKLQLLQQIKFYDCQYLKAPKLKNMSNLKTIEICNINISELKLKNLPKIQKVTFNGCVQLKYITIINCQVLKDMDFTPVQQLYSLHLQNLLQLKSLTFKNCENLNNFQAINCNKLKIINLEEGQLDRMQLLFKEINLRFQQINFKKCSKIKNVKLLNSHSIHKLIFSQTNIKDQELEYIANHLLYVKHLELENCKKLTQFKITRCKNLKTLNLNGCKISDSIINQLAINLPKLKNFYLNQYDQKQGIKFINFKQLQILEIPAYNLSEVQLKQLSQLKKLQQLNLSGGNTLQGLSFINYKNLKKLSLRYTKINDEKFNQICINSLSLLQLDLFGCKELSIVNFGNLKKLKILNISQTYITQVNLSEQIDLEELKIQSCYRLKKLTLSKCQKFLKFNLSQSYLKSAQLQNIINNIPQLKQLNLNHYQKNLYPKLKCNKLNKLTLSGSVSQTQLNHMLEFLKQQTLQYLCLANCQYIMKFQFLNCKKLKYLNLEWTNIVDLSEKVTGEFYQLQELILYKCQKLKTIKLKKSPKLKKLNLGCVPIQTNQLLELSKDLISLQELNIYKYPHIGGCNIKHFKQLKKLDLSYSQIKSNQLNRIIKQLKHLEQINLNGCKQLNEVKFNQEQCLKLKKISLDHTKLIKIQLPGKPYLEKLNIQQSDIGQITISNCKIFNQIRLQLVYDLSIILLNGLPKLQQFRLGLNQIPTITLQDWSSVKKLSFTCCNIKSFKLSQYMKKSTNLKYLNLSNSQSLTYLQLDLCKSLENVTLFYTSLPKQKVQQMKRNFPQIQFQTS